MIGINNVSSTNYTKLKELDKADNSQDNKIVIKNLSQTDKNKLLETLNNIVTEDKKNNTLTPEDKAKINAALISLTSKGGTGKGASYLEFKNNDLSFPDKSKSSSPQTTAPPEKTEKAKEINAINEPKKISEVENTFRKGNIVYSQNFGLIDSHHIKHHSLAFVQVYNAAIKSLKTGEEQSVTIKCGSGAHAHNFQYKIKANSGDDLLKIARDVATHASYAYEEKSVHLFGLVNHVASVVGFGTSAFSTEDLPSNAIGIHAAEQYIRSQTKDDNNPDQSLIDELGSISAPPSTNDAGEKFSNRAINWTVKHAGELSYKDNFMEPSTMDNKSFKPKYALSLESLGVCEEKPNKAETAFFDTFESDKAYKKEKDTGWKYED